MDDPRRVGASGRSVQQELAALAVEQGGAWTRAQAVAAGLTDGQLRTLLGRTWSDPYRGVYVGRAVLAAAGPQQRHVFVTARRTRSCAWPLCRRRTGPSWAGSP